VVALVLLPVLSCADDAPEGEESQSDVPPAIAMAEREFSTDFSKTAIDLSSIRSGGPPKDGIPPIDEPRFLPVAEADGWLAPREPVIYVEVGEQGRAYPLRILMFHEIVNDTAARNVPVTVTYCPLCNTAIAFDRRLGERVLDFGTSGRLRLSNLIMYDRQTETWWQQATGRAIVGELVGEELTKIPAPIIPYGEFRLEHPDGLVLSADTGYDRPYGQNPYAGYDEPSRRPFLFPSDRAIPEDLPPMARVLLVEIENEERAYAYDTLSRVGVINDTVAGTPIVVMWRPGTASALHAGQVAEGRDVGSATAFERRAAEQVLTFVGNEDGMFDRETGSRWSLLGKCVAGELAGEELTPVVGVNHFWFSSAAFAGDAVEGDSTPDGDA
jgi:hypothetical protein